MSSLRIANSQIAHMLERFPTLSKTWEGSLYKKIGFVFLSVLTAGILPLSLIMYDVAKDLMYGNRLNKAVLIKGKQKTIPFFQRVHFTIPKNLAEDLNSVKDYLVTVAGISGICVGSIFLLKKTYGPISYLKDQISDITARSFNIFSNKMLEISASLTEFFNGFSNEVKFGAKLSVGLFIGAVVAKKLIRILRKEDDRKDSRVPSAPDEPKKSGSILSRIYPILPPRDVYDPASGNRPPPTNPYLS